MTRLFGEAGVAVREDAGGLLCEDLRDLVVEELVGCDIVRERGYRDKEGEKVGTRGCVE